MNPMSLKKRRFYFYVFLLIFLAVIPIITLYTSGYRLTGDLHLVKTGGIYVYTPYKDTSIYIDGKEYPSRGIFQHDLFVQNLRPKTYSVLVSKDGYWPWVKEITVEEQLVTNAIAFLVPKEPSGDILPAIITETNGGTATTTKPNPEYEKIIARFDSTPVIPPDTNINATDTPKILSYRKNVALWKNGTDVFAEWLGAPEDLPDYFCRKDICTSPVSVFSSYATIKNIGFYPNREDVILIAIQTGIYAIEIDARKTQNFQPVYKGIDPYFIFEDGELFVRDGENIFVIYL